MSEANKNDGGPAVDLLLFQVGQNVRGLRRQHDLTRRDLAAAARISERYLGQLENGQANVSLNILQRLIGYFGVPMSDILPVSGDFKTAYEPLGTFISDLSKREQEEACKLLQERFGKTRRQRKGIALVGLRGAGKTTHGAKLSDLIGLPFVSLSRLVAERVGMDMAELMELSGQDGFRRFELETLTSLIDQPGQVILETSGGIAAADETYDLLLNHFFTIWIKARPEEHMQRVIGQNDLRPITGRREAMKDLVGILNERNTAYARADYVLDTSDRSVRECLAELVEIGVRVVDGAAQVAVPAQG